MPINLVAGKATVLSRERSESGAEIYMIMFEDSDNKPVTSNAIHGTSLDELSSNFKSNVGIVNDKFYIRNYDAEPLGQSVKPLPNDQYIALLNLIAS